MTSDVERGAMVIKGKIKTGYAVLGSPHSLIMQSNNDITKNDDPAQTMEMASKAKFSTITTSLVFELLKKAGIPVAYERQLSETEFLTARCQMIPLEVVIRRYADGSYLKRHPNLKQKIPLWPHRFHNLVFELFLKTTGGKAVTDDGTVFVETPIDSANGRPIDDPFISNPENSIWDLKHPKFPSWDGQSNLNCCVFRKNVLPDGVTVEKIKEIAHKVFLVLENAWAQLGYRLVDFKIELGIDCNGRLLVADVIDNDSWRLRTKDWEEISKQLFRDNFDMNIVADKYALVAELVGRFVIPRQAIVLWRASDSDTFPEFPEVAGVTQIKVTESGHKSPLACLMTLENILAQFPEGGVILAVVGMSNGLGPMLASRTSWPVIAVPQTAKERPHDVWSSLDVPSNVPLLTILSSKNAVLAALNILAQKNPVASMHRQYALEKLDE